MISQRRLFTLEFPEVGISYIDTDKRTDIPFRIQKMTTQVRVLSDKCMDRLVHTFGADGDGRLIASEFP